VIGDQVIGDQVISDWLSVSIIQAQRARHEAQRTRPLISAHKEEYMKRCAMLIAIFLTIVYAGTVFAKNEMSAQDILDRLDHNMWTESARAKIKMMIHTRRRTDEKEMIGWSEGGNKSFTEMLSPARDKGSKYLKLEDNMWIYLPKAEKVIKISGHMLRQSMMGSDFSYEDTMERSQKLRESYAAKLVGTETVGERPCYVLELEAIKHNVTYYRRKMWIDQENFVGLKEELYAKSGKLLKVMMANQIKVFGGRHYPTHITMEDKLRKGSYTEMFVTEIAFNVDIPPMTFSKRNLGRK